MSQNRTFRSKLLIIVISILIPIMLPSSSLGAVIEYDTVRLPDVKSIVDSDGESALLNADGKMYLFQDGSIHQIAESLANIEATGTLSGNKAFFTYRVTNNVNQIAFFDLSSGVLSTISTNLSNKYNLHTNGNILVWSEQSGESSAIYEYDIKSARTLVVAEESRPYGGLANPAVNDEAIFWHHNDVSNTLYDQLYRKDLASNTISAIGVSSYGIGYVVADDNHVAWVTQKISKSHPVLGNNYSFSVNTIEGENVIEIVSDTLAARNLELKSNLLVWSGVNAEGKKNAAKQYNYITKASGDITQGETTFPSTDGNNILVHEHLMGYERIVSINALTGLRLFESPNCERLGNYSGDPDNNQKIVGSYILWTGICNNTVGVYMAKPKYQMPLPIGIPKPAL